MRLLKSLIALAVLCLGVAWTAPAMAYGHFHGGRVGVGLVVGAGFGPWYYPYYYGPYTPYAYGAYPYYAPAIAPAPTAYVEQGGGAAPQQAANYWYYCADPQGYYPYVQQCRNGWQRVSPTPQQ